MESVVLKKVGSVVALFASSFLLQPSLAEGVAWTNLDKEHRLGGRMVSEGYMRGKTALVCSVPQNDAEAQALLARLESVWRSYKSKPFVLLGSFQTSGKAADEVRAFVEEQHLTFACYMQAGLAANAPETPFYVVDGAGLVRYKGRDERRAEEQLVQVLTDMEVPKNVQTWERIIGFELTVLPGRAFLRLSEYREKFPAEAKKYDKDYRRLKSNAEVQKLAKLVAFSKKAKDFDPTNKKTRGQVSLEKIEHVRKQYEPLAKSENPLVAQEAKNALADLKWTEVNFR